MNQNFVSLARVLNSSKSSRSCRMLEVLSSEARRFYQERLLAFNTSSSCEIKRSKIQTVRTCKLCSAQSKKFKHTAIRKSIAVKTEREREKNVQQKVKSWRVRFNKQTDQHFPVNILAKYWKAAWRTMISGRGEVRRQTQIQAAEDWERQRVKDHFEPERKRDCKAQCQSAPFIEII